MRLTKPDYFLRLPPAVGPRDEASPRDDRSAAQRFAGNAAPAHRVTRDAPWYWQKFNFFDEADGAARSAFFDDAKRASYRRSQTIFMPTDAADRVFYLRSGMVKIYHLSAQGDPTIFWFCVPGDLFGAGGLSGSLQQSVYGEATESSVVYTISRTAFEVLLKCHPQLAINVIRLMGARLRLACDSMTDLVSQLTNVRLARALLRLAYNCGVLHGDRVVLRLRITHEELANMIGASRQTVSEALRDLCARGLIEIERRIITIPAPERLQELIDTALDRNEHG